MTDRLTNHRVEWKEAQPSVDEALAFADLGLPAMEYSNSYGRALRALAAEVRRLRAAAEPSRECRLEELANHLRHCRTCGELDVKECSTGSELWEVAMPSENRVEPSADAMDAARYRWLKEANPAALATIAWRVPEACADAVNQRSVDEAIDAARAAENRGDKHE